MFHSNFFQKGIMSDISNLYIDLLKKTITNTIHEEKFQYLPVGRSKNPAIVLFRIINSILGLKNFEIRRKVNFENVKTGRIWPDNAETMIGIDRLNNIEYCIRQIIKDNVQGDFVETGVWRGGAVIFMKAVLTAFNINNRVIWAADSFEGLPKPNGKYEADIGDKHYTITEIATSLEQVKENFEKYNMLDDNVKFLKGWFKDTLPTAPINKIAMLRLDGDLYESTMDSLNNLYHKLSRGGFLIVDDYYGVPTCKKAIDDFRKEKKITEEMIQIDWTGVYWRKK